MNGKMWFNGDNNDMYINMNMDTSHLLAMNNMPAMDMNTDFNMSPINNHDPFAFSLHSNNMQQGTEPATPAIGVSIPKP